MQVLASCLAAALKAGDAASLLIAANRNLVHTLMPIARQHDVAVLIDDDAQMTVDLDADGVHIPGNREAYNRARILVGPTRIVGADCGSSRHNAMELAEAGADYIMLDASFTMEEGDTLISWWATVMEIPCVTGQPAGPEKIRKLTATGADFIRPEDTMWTSPESAARVVRQANQAIAEVIA